MDFFYLGILIFLFVLATFDLSVGVANDAVNFLSPAVGAKAAKFRTILVVAAIGIFVGASTSSGMMDIARHGVLNPHYYSLDDVISYGAATGAVMAGYAGTTWYLMQAVSLIGFVATLVIALRRNGKKEGK